MSQEHAAAAALHAAKMAQLNASGLLPPHFDLSKIAGSAAGAAFGAAAAAANSTNNSGLSIEPIMRRDIHSPAAHEGTAASSNSVFTNSNSTDIRRGDSSEPMDLGLEGNNQSGSNNEGAHSDHEDNYSEDEGVHNT